MLDILKMCMKKFDAENVFWGNLQGYVLDILKMCMKKFDVENVFWGNLQGF